MSKVVFEGIARKIQMDQQPFVAVWTDGVMLSSDNGKSRMLPGLSAPCAIHLVEGKKYKICIEEVNSEVLENNVENLNNDRW